MKVDELTFPYTMRGYGRNHPEDTAAGILIKHGWVDIGEGFSGSVFEHPDKSYVIKLFLAFDDQYMKYLDIIKQNTNPHFPLLYKKLVKITDDYYVVRMEKLYTPDHSGYNLYKKCVEYMSGDQPWNEIDFGKYKDQEPSLHSACDIIKKNFLPKSIDNNVKNIMVRQDDTLVFIDPVV